MRNDIITNLNNPNQLEKLYRSNKSEFKKEFNLLYPEIKENPVIEFWNERLNYESGEISWGKQNELTFVIIISLIAGFIAKLPDFSGANPEFFYQRNIGFIIFPLLMVYFAWRNNFAMKKLVPGFVVIFISMVYINILPENYRSDTLILSCIHLPLS